MSLTMVDLLDDEQLRRNLSNVSHNVNDENLLESIVQSMSMLWKLSGTKEIPLVVLAHDFKTIFAPNSANFFKLENPLLCEGILSALYPQHSDEIREYYSWFVSERG